jgi:hypothetical protein
MSKTLGLAAAKSEGLRAKRKKARRSMERVKGSKVKKVRDVLTHDS